MLLLFSLFYYQQSISDYANKSKGTQLSSLKSDYSVHNKEPYNGKVQLRTFNLGYLVKP